MTAGSVALLGCVVAAAVELLDGVEDVPLVVVVAAGAETAVAVVEPAGAEAAGPTVMTPRAIAKVAIAAAALRRRSRVRRTRRAASARAALGFGGVEGMTPWCAWRMSGR